MLGTLISGNLHDVEPETRFQDHIVKVGIDRSLSEAAQHSSCQSRPSGCYSKTRVRWLPELQMMDSLAKQAEQLHSGGGFADTLLCRLK